MDDFTNMILRYYIGFDKTDERFEMLIDFLKRTGIKRVILFPLRFMKEAPFSPKVIIRSTLKCCSLILNSSEI